MYNNVLRSIWPMLRKVQPWWFLIAALVCSVFAVYQLRANNLEMIQLRTAVYEADKNDGDVQKELTELQRYVTRHMNTNLSGGQNAVYPPIQLKYTYERIKTEKLKGASNEQVYVDAQVFCEQRDPQNFSGRSRVPCIEEYVKANGAGSTAVPDSLYKFDFRSPKWSPDAAGFGILATVASFSTAGGVWVVKRHIKNRLG